jgi:hypothetical protein
MPDFVSITPLETGDGIDYEFLDAILADLEFLNARAASAEFQNGSFEADTDGDGTPDWWTLTGYDGGSAAIATTGAHGAKSLALTATAGGGYVEALSSEYIATGAGQRLEVPFWLKATAATVRAAVQVLWYDEDKGYLSASTVFDAEAGLPAAWTRYRGQAVQVVTPATACFYRVKLIGGKSGGAVGGVVSFDGLEPFRYRGWVYTEETELTDPYTVEASGEIPLRALIRADLRPDTGYAGNVTIVGDGVTVFTWDHARGDVVVEAWVPLPADGTFDVNITEDLASSRITLLGYEV